MPKLNKSHFLFKTPLTTKTTTTTATQFLVLGIDLKDDLGRSVINVIDIVV